MKKLLALIAFSVLLLVPVGAQQVFADHPGILTCLPPGYLLDDPAIFDVNDNVSTPYCFHSLTPPSDPPPTCNSPYVLRSFVTTVTFQLIFQACHLGPQLAPDTTLAAQCQDGAIIQNNHCVPDLDQICGGGTTISNMMCMASLAVGGYFVGVEHSALLLQATQITAAWMIPVIVSSIGFGIVIARKL